MNKRQAAVELELLGVELGRRVYEIEQAFAAELGARNVLDGLEAIELVPVGTSPFFLGWSISAIAEKERQRLVQLLGSLDPPPAIEGLAAAPQARPPRT